MFQDVFFASCSAFKLLEKEMDPLVFFCSTFFYRHQLVLKDFQIFVLLDCFIASAMRLDIGKNYIPTVSFDLQIREIISCIHSSAQEKGSLPFWFINFNNLKNLLIAFAF